MPIEKRLQAAHVLMHAKSKKAKQADIDAAMICMVNKGTNSTRLKQRLQTWGFSEADADALIKKFYPQPAA